MGEHAPLKSAGSVAAQKPEQATSAKQFRTSAFANRMRACGCCPAPCCWARSSLREATLYTTEVCSPAGCLLKRPLVRSSIERTVDLLCCVSSGSACTPDTCVLCARRVASGRESSPAGAGEGVSAPCVVCAVTGERCQCLYTQISSSLCGADSQWEAHT